MGKAKIQVFVSVAPLELTAFSLPLEVVRKSLLDPSSIVFALCVLRIYLSISFSDWVPKQAESN